MQHRDDRRPGSRAPSVAQQPGGGGAAQAPVERDAQQQRRPSTSTAIIEIGRSRSSHSGHSQNGSEPTV